MPPSASSSSSFAWLNLTGVLAALGVLDALVHRVLVRLLLPDPSLGAPINRALQGTAAFVTNFAGLLAFLLFVGVLARALTRAELFPRALRLSLFVVGAVFMAIAAAGLVLGPLSDRQFLHARTAHVFLSLFAALALWRSEAERRTKLTLAMFSGALALGGFALFCDRVGWAPGKMDPGDLVRAGQLLALVAATLSALMLFERPSGLATLVAPAVALLAATLAGIGLITKLSLVQTIALHAFRLEVPPPVSLITILQLVLFVFAVLGATLAVTLGLFGSPRSRLLAYGLVLVVTGGFQPGGVTQLLLSVTGLFALAFGARPLSPVVPIATAATAAAAPATQP